MPQFPVTPEREKILARIPDYAVEITPEHKRVTVKHGDRIIADSTDALLIRETKHADVWYLPRKDVDMSLLEPTEHSTFCPFKGHASYWSLATEDVREENIVWSYEDPYDEVAGIRDYLSFYPQKVEVIVG